MDERIWYIKRCDLFTLLTNEQLARIEARARIRRFPKRSAIYLPSDTAEGVFLLAEGRVKLCSTTPDGKEAIFAFIEPGELFGELSLLVGGQRDERAEAVLPSTVVLIPADLLDSIMYESPRLSLGVTKLIGFRRQRIERRLKALLFRSNRDRLIHVLLELSEQFGRNGPDGVLLATKLSHQDLASVIGATRETVTLLLGELQLEGLVKVARQRITLRQPERLARCIDASPRPTGMVPERQVPGRSRFERPATRTTRGRE